MPTIAKYTLIQAIHWLLRILWWVVLIDVILTWFPTVDRRNPIVVTLRRITEPLYRPIRKLIPPIRAGAGAIDLSPLILLVLLSVLERIAIYVIVRA